jgi:hypothetical protein
MDEEIPTNAGLTQKNCAGWLSKVAQVAVAGKGPAVLCTCQKKCNEYILTTAQCF